MRELKYKQIWYGGDTTDEVIDIPSNMLLIKTPNEYNKSCYIYDNAEHYCGICKLTDGLPEFDCDEDGYNIIDDIGGDTFSDIALCDWTDIILSDECKDLVITPEKAAELFNLSDYYIVRFQHNGAFEGIYNITKIYNTSNVETNNICNILMNTKFCDKTTPKEIQYNDIVDIYKLTKNFITDNNYFATVCNSKQNPYVKKLFENLIDYVVYTLIKKNTEYEYALYNVDYCMCDCDEFNVPRLVEWCKKMLDYFYLIKQFPLKKV